MLTHQRNNSAKDPDDDAESYGASVEEGRGGGDEDAGADHDPHDHVDRREEAQLPLQPDAVDGPLLESFHLLPIFGFKSGHLNI